MSEEDMPRSVCCGVIRRASTKEERTDDGKFYYWPHMVGNCILLYGKKNSRFPRQAFVGPEWPCMFFTTSLIAVPTYFWLVNVAKEWHPAVLISGTLSGVILLSAYLLTACSDPGIVWVEPEANLDSVKVATQGKTREEKLEAGSASMNKAESNKPRMIMCGTCQLERPVTAKHCYECGVCVDNLDHHCPWTGKCIAKKNLTTFYVFIWSLVLHLIFVITLVIVNVSADKPIS